MYLLFDIGGTKMRLAVSRSGEHLGETSIIPSIQNPEEAWPQILEESKRLLAGAVVTHIAGGLPGPLDETKSFLVNAPHLPQWKGFPIRAKFEEAFGVPTMIENDSALVGLGEAIVGAGKGQPIVAYLAIGTGVGGARIVNRKIDLSARGFEPGHQIIGSDLSTLESAVSGSALGARFGMPAADIADAAVFEDAARKLAVAIHNTIVYWSPHVVVLGGSVMKRISIDTIRAEVSKIASIFPDLPPIVLGELGDSGGLEGARVWILQQQYHV